jgi:hypothetical protein
MLRKILGIWTLKEEVTENLPLSSFLGSTAQLRPWPPPQNPAEFLGGFSIFLQGRVFNPTPNPHPGGPGLCIYIPQRQDPHGDYRESVKYIMQRIIICSLNEMWLW